MAKFNSTVTRAPQLVVQSLAPVDAEAKPIAAGDQIEIQYAGWLYANDTIGTVRGAEGL